jgi:sugar phosphate isomerase/epimerase
VTGILPPSAEPPHGVLKKVQINIPFPMLLENLEGILAMGLQPEVYFSGLTLDRLSGPDVEKASRKLTEKHTPVTFHGPFMDLSPGSVDEKIRQVTAFRLNQVMELAPHFRPRAIVFHAGYDRWRYDGDEVPWLEKSLLTWRPFVERAEPLDLRLALENVYEENPSILRRLLEAIDSPHLGFCLDAGHGYIFSQVPLREWVEVLGPWLIEVHLHDNHRGADEHLPLGFGEIDFPGIFTSLQGKNLRPIYTLEPHLPEHLEPSLKALEKFLP